MGFSLKKIVKSVTKPIEKAVQTVAAIPKDPLGSISSLAKQAANVGIDVATGGNKNLVDGLTGGLASSAVNAAGGDTKDIARIGVTGGAALVGGPGAAIAANQILASGGNPLQAAMAAAQGGDMGFLGGIGDFLNSNPGIQQLANNALSGIMPKSAPVVQTVAPAVQTIEVPGKAAGMSQGMMLGIGAGVLGLVLVLVLALKRK